MIRTPNRRLAGLALAMLAMAQSAQGAGGSAGGSAGAESPWRLGIAIGYGMRANPLIQSDDIPLVVDLDIAWFGERFFFDNGDLGWTLLDKSSYTLNLVGRVNSDRVFFDKTDIDLVSIGPDGQLLAQPAQVEVPDRDYAVELGVELLTDGEWGQLHATAHHDVSGTHDGFELYVNYAYRWRRGRWFFEPSLGASFKSSAQNDYYWGVRPSESSVLLPAYEAGDGLNAHARLVARYQITKRWSFAVAAEFERLNDAAANSPIVDERNVLGFFAGFGFRL